MFAEFLQDYNSRFPEQGKFELHRGEPYKVSGVPEAPGVYLIYGRTGSQVELLYVGRSGTMETRGSFSDQMLYTRLARGKQDGQSRKVWCPWVIEEFGLDALVFHWIVTFSDSIRVLPAKAEADLLQAYFDEFGRLPPKNKGF